MIERLELAHAEVHIHFASLDLADHELVTLESLLSEDELTRTERMRNRVVRSRFIAGRGFLRQTLARYLGSEPQAVRLAEGEHGKPFLVDSTQHEKLRFNLSHKHERAVLATSGGCEVGVDLEQLRDTLPFRRMAERFFFAAETEEMLSLPEEQQLAAFYRCWTRKEAYLKGLGTGLTRPANSFQVSLLPDQPPLLNDFQHPSTGSNWVLADITVPEGYLAALALEGTLQKLRTFPLALGVCRT